MEEQGKHQVKIVGLTGQEMIELLELIITRHNMHVDWKLIRI